MKRKYLEPEFDLLKFRFDAMMDTRVDHSTPEGFGDGGEEGPEE